MKRQITNFSPVQTGKVFALLYFIFTIPFAIMFAFIFSVIPNKGESPPILLLVAMPFLYALFGFLFVALAALAYNFAAKKVGGIEYTATDVN